MSKKTLSASDTKQEEKSDTVTELICFNLELRRPSCLLQPYMFVPTLLRPIKFQ